MTKPIPRRNFHRGAGRTAGGSERRPDRRGSSRRRRRRRNNTSSRATNLKNSQDRAAWMRRRHATRRTTNACSRTPRQSPSVITNVPGKAVAGRAIVGTSSSRGRTPRERWCLRVTGAGRMPAECAARGPEARYDQAHPTPELPQGSRQDAGGSERRPSDEGRAAGGGDAATRPQAAHQPKELHKTSRMDAATPRNPSNDQRAFAHSTDNPKRVHERPRQGTAGRATPGTSSSRGRTPRERWCSRATGAGSDCLVCQASFRLSLHVSTPGASGRGLVRSQQAGRRPPSPSRHRPGFVRAAK